MLVKVPTYVRFMPLYAHSIPASHHIFKLMRCAVRSRSLVGQSVATHTHKTRMHTHTRTRTRMAVQRSKVSPASRWSQGIVFWRGCDRWVRCEVSTFWTFIIPTVPNSYKTEGTRKPKETSHMFEALDLQKVKINNGNIALRHTLWKQPQERIEDV